MTKVLLIEDERDLRQATRDVLYYGGYEVLEAEDGAVGLELAREHLPDIILSDIIMPSMDGYDLIQALQENAITATIPIIFLTALSESRSMRQGMQLGADDYLVKPVMPDDLYTAIETRLKKHERIVQKHDTALSELRQNIVYALPHEMRTPLHLIMGFSNMLQINHESADPDEILKSATAIFEASKRLERMTENYLIYAQLEVIAADPQEQANLTRYTTDNAHEHIAGAAEDVAGNRERTGDLRFDLAPVALHISDESLMKMIRELVDNALKFSEAGTPVEVRGVDQDGYYSILIEDHGHGMEAEAIQKIGAYMQFDRTLYEQQGLGLGLIIAKRLAELHNGRLTVESRKNVGTSVRVDLPL